MPGSGYPENIPSVPSTAIHHPIFMPDFFKGIARIPGTA
jgi:hypothetical protein